MMKTGYALKVFIYILYHIMLIYSNDTDLSFGNIVNKNKVIYNIANHV